MSVYFFLTWLLVHCRTYSTLIEAKDKMLFTTELGSYYLETG